MKGLELCRRYYEEVGRPALARACPELLPRLAAGLVGEGSECLGYDDDISQDHDWGPGFCLWLTRADLAQWGQRAAEIYGALPKTYLGYTRLREQEMSAGRVGVLCVEDFYARFLGRSTSPQEPLDWLRIPDQALQVCTNGAVFEDGPGAFTAFRQTLLAYYPEEVRRKRLAARCALAAQSGQYNLPRCLRRGERVAALRALAEFVDHAQGAFFLLERTYRPYYKWAHRALAHLPRWGGEAAPLFERMAACPLDEAVEPVEEASALLIRALGEEGLPLAEGDFLLPYAQQLQASIRDPLLQSLPLMAGA